jgi:hypothetical protein
MLGVFKLSGTTLAAGDWVGIVEADVVGAERDAAVCSDWVGKPDEDCPEEDCAEADCPKGACPEEACPGMNGSDGEPADVVASELVALVVAGVSIIGMT